MSVLPDFDEAVYAWSTVGGLLRAGELASAALTGNIDSNAARDAAFVLIASSESSALQRYLAGGVLDSQRNESPFDQLLPTTYEGEAITIARLRVGELRARLRRFPRNALAWTDLAREYWILAEEPKARRALETALALDGQNRFIVRSAVLFYAATGDESRASRVLSDGPDPEDPWVAAAGIGLRLRGRPAMRVRSATRLLESSDLAPWHLGELAAGLATREFEEGNERSGRRLMRRALLDPTENVAAQAEWARHRGMDLGGPPEAISAAASYEAQARRHAAEGAWTEATGSAVLWLADQPFSLDAAGSASYFAIEARSYALAESILTGALRTNPLDASLLNNRAYSRACSWDLVGAASDLSAVSVEGLDPSTYGCVLATSGLVLFRAGEAALGRQYYERSIRVFTRASLMDSAARAAVNLAGEELREGSVELESALRRAKTLVDRSADFDVSYAWRRLTQESRPSHGGGFETGQGFGVPLEGLPPLGNTTTDSR